MNKMKKHKITIEIKADGTSLTKIAPCATLPFTTIDVGMALASATRVFALAAKDAMKLSAADVEQIEAQIAEVYNNDLKMGDTGEAETTHPADDE